MAQVKDHLLTQDWHRLRPVWSQPLVLLGILVTLGAGLLLKEWAWFVAFGISILAIYSLHPLFTQKPDHVSPMKLVASRYLTLFLAILVLIGLDWGDVAIIHWLFPAIFPIRNALIIGSVMTLFILFILFWIAPFFFAFGQQGYAYGFLVLLVLFYGLGHGLVPERYMRIFLNKNHLDQSLVHTGVFILSFVCLSFVASIFIVRHQQRHS